MQKIISVTDFVRNATRLADEMEQEGTVYRLTRGGRGSMVVMSDEYFQGWLAMIEEMQDPNWREELAQARRDAAAGRVHSLDEVAKELGVEEGSSHPRRTKSSPRATRSGAAKDRKRPARPRRRAA